MREKIYIMLEIRIIMRYSQGGVKMSETTEDIILRFHARVSSGGRITLPETSRKYLNLKSGDFVKIKVKKIVFDENRLSIKRIAEAIAYAKIASRGQITIPEHIRALLGIKEGDIIEIDLLEFSPVVPRNG